MAERGGVDSLNIVIGANTDALKKGLDDAVKAVQQGSNKVATESKRMADAMRAWQKSVDDVGVAASRKQRALFNLAMGYEQMGTAGKANLRATMVAARENKDAIEDMQMAIQASTMEGKFQMAARAIGEVTQVLAGAKGAMMALGMSGEDAQESMAKLQGMMAFANGIAMMAGLDGAIKALIPSLGAATAGLTGFKAALASTGIGLAAVAVGYLVTELLDLIPTVKDVEKANQAAMKAQEDLLNSLRGVWSNSSKAMQSYLLELEAGGATEKELHAEKIKQMKAQLVAFEATKGAEQDAYEMRLAIMDEENRYKIQQRQKQEQENSKRNAEHKKRIEQQKAEAAEYKRMVSMLGDLQARTDISEVMGKDAKPIALALDVDLRVKDLRGRVGKLVDDINASLDSGIKSMAVNMAGALSDLAMNIVAGAEQPLAKFGDALLSTLAGFMQTLGQAMISAGLASQTFQKVLFTQPGLAIAAGAGLMVAAGVVKGIMQKGIEGRKSPSGGANGETPQGIRPFADGGIISGPTLGLMGEYPGARSNPEVVAPLNKLKDMIGGGGNLTTRVSGQDLLIMLDRAETNRGRVR
jgi:hypothetical protein